MLRLCQLCSAFLLVLAAGTSTAHDYLAGELHIVHPWIAEPPPGARVAAGYLAIANDGDGADRLVAAEAGFAARTQIHEMAVDAEGVMRMRPVEDGLALDGGDVVLLEPGGLHIMFLSLTEDLREGEYHAVTLVFEHAGAIEVEFVVEPAGFDGDHGSHAAPDEGEP